MAEMIKTGLTYNSTSIILNISGEDYEIETDTSINIGDYPITYSLTASKNRKYSLEHTTGNTQPQEITITLSAFANNDISKILIKAFKERSFINFTAIDTVSQNTISLTDCRLIKMPMQQQIAETDNEKEIILNLQSASLVTINGK